MEKNNESSWGEILSQLIHALIFGFIGGILFVITAGIWQIFGWILGIISCLIITFFYAGILIQKTIFNLVEIDTSKIKVGNSSSLSLFYIVMIIIIILFHIAVVYLTNSVYIIPFLIGAFLFFNIELGNDSGPGKHHFLNFFLKAPICLIIAWGFGLLTWLSGSFMGIPKLDLWYILLIFTFMGLFAAIFPEISGLKVLIGIIFGIGIATEIFWLAGIFAFVAFFFGSIYCNDIDEKHVIDIKLKNWRNQILSENQQTENV